MTSLPFSKNDDYQFTFDDLCSNVNFDDILIFVVNFDNFCKSSKI